ncbi:MAG: 30S ribosomal protein S6 [Erysipelotrichaceae bacterium]|nr:30S ribosomal protein S6 [Erysipelotrichaceae bacterium]
MNKYEIMFIVRSDIDEDTRKNTVKALEKILTDSKTTITLSKELGQKEFAYEIKKMKSGYYYLYNIETDSNEVTKEFDRVARIDENIVRHLILKIED